MPQTTSCCRETAQALEEKYAAKTAVLRKIMEQTMSLVLKTSFLFSVLLLSGEKHFELTTALRPLMFRTTFAIA